MVKNLVFRVLCQNGGTDPYCSCLSPLWSAVCIKDNYLSQPKYLNQCGRHSQNSNAQSHVSWTFYVFIIAVWSLSKQRCGGFDCIPIYSDVGSRYKNMLCILNRPQRYLIWNSTYSIKYKNMLFAKFMAEASGWTYRCLRALLKSQVVTEYLRAFT